MTRKTTLLSLSLALLFSTSAYSQDYSTARDVIEANLEATGGTEAWKAIKTITLGGTRMLDTPMGKRKSVFTTYARYPGYNRTEELIDSPMGEMEQLIVSTPEGRWTKAMGGRREMPARDWISSQYAKDEVFLLSDDRVELAPLEKETDETGPVYVVSFTFEGEVYRRKYSQFTLFLTAAEAPDNSGVKNWSNFDDYRQIGGFHMPFLWGSVASITVNMNGEESSSTITVATTLESVIFNEEMSDDLFMK